MSFDCDASRKAIDRIRAESPAERSKFLLDVFVKFFGDGIAQNPKAFSGRFRKMSSSAFNFYRGSALLFYQDLKVDQDKWIQTEPKAGSVFIHVRSTAPLLHHRCSTDLGRSARRELRVVSEHRRDLEFRRQRLRRRLLRPVHLGRQASVSVVVSDLSQQRLCRRGDRGDSSSMRFVLRETSLRVLQTEERSFRLDFAEHLGQSEEIVERDKSEVSCRPSRRDDGDRELRSTIHSIENGHRCR